jgi:hypothetical protein
LTARPGHPNLVLDARRRGPSARCERAIRTGGRSEMSMSMEVVAALVFVGLSVVGLLVVRRRVPLPLLEEHHEVAGVCFAVIGGLYGIILAFVMVSSWERYETARQDTETEASAAADLYRHSGGFGEPLRSQLGSAVIAYVESVIDDEFPAMETGASSPVTQERFYAVGNALFSSHPEDSWDVALWQSTLDRLDDFSDARRDRLFYLESGLPGIIWVFLVVFGFATVGFTFMFGMPRALPQVVITVVLAGTIAWTMILVHETQEPFSGDLRVDARAFRIALAFMKQQETVRAPLPPQATPG